MTRDQVQALLERHTAAWNHRDVAALTASHADVGVVWSPMFGRVEGRPQIEHSYRSLFSIFPDWQIRFEPALIDGDRLAESFAVTATQLGEFLGFPGTGKRCLFEGVSIILLNDDGLIVEERRTYDFTAVLAQMGVIRTKMAH
jgi:steroid delta-isomerase-like uncharacterized protein